jgi:hypothetical protein
MIGSNLGLKELTDRLSRSLIKHPKSLTIIILRLSARYAVRSCERRFPAFGDDAETHIIHSLPGEVAESKTRSTPGWNITPGATTHDLAPASFQFLCFIASVIRICRGGGASELRGRSRAYRKGPTHWFVTAWSDGDEGPVVEARFIGNPIVETRWIL